MKKFFLSCLISGPVSSLRMAVAIVAAAVVSEDGRCFFKVLNQGQVDSSLVDTGEETTTGDVRKNRFNGYFKSPFERGTESIDSGRFFVRALRIVRRFRFFLVDQSFYGR
ncbi:MAG: hypothetical protein AAGE99_02570 [Chlamydiota bacterium]